MFGISYSSENIVDLIAAANTATFSSSLPPFILSGPAQRWVNAAWAAWLTVSARTKNLISSANFGVSFCRLKMYESHTANHSKLSSPITRVTGRGQIAASTVILLVELLMKSRKIVESTILAAGRQTPPRRIKQHPRPSFITSVVVRRRGAALSFLSRVSGRRQANTAPDACSSGFRAHPSNLWLLPSSPPRRAAARIALTRPIDVPRAGLQLRFWLPAGKYEASSSGFSSCSPRLSLLLPLLRRAAALYPLTRRIAARRVVVLFFLTSVSLGECCCRRKVDLDFKPRYFDVRRATSPSPLCNSKNFRCAAFIINLNINPQNQKFDFCASAERCFHLVIDQSSREFPSRCAGHSSTLTPHFGNPRFRAPASKVLSLVVFRLLKFLSTALICASSSPGFQIDETVPETERETGFARV
ncbi:hypothetical protein R3P38DRAFT_2762327 [Favolaschia claudopus]|uniref:Uncharacterized protein n=1 Tax=Favolaschia claudopus TaxID=2862362 RepID=A0AAW0DK56_9AGAR